MVSSTCERWKSWHLPHWVNVRVKVINVHKGLRAALDFSLPINPQKMSAAISIIITTIIITIIYKMAFIFLQHNELSTGIIPKSRSKSMEIKGSAPALSVSRARALYQLPCRTLLPAEECTELTAAVGKQATGYRPVMWKARRRLLPREYR